MNQAPEEFFYATLARVNQTLAQDSSIVQQGNFIYLLSLPSKRRSRR